jgi:SPP1 family predicted phage head-tail adaptor
MHAGRRDRPVQLQTRTESTGPTGQVLEGWSPLTTVWATVEVLAGDESWDGAAAQRTAMQRVTFTIRWRPGLSPRGTRVVWEGREYDVKNVAEVGRQDALALTCEAREVAPGGEE